MHYLEYEKERSLIFDSVSAKLVHDRPREPKQGEIIVMYLSKGAAKITVT